MRIRAEVELKGKTATGFTIPEDAVLSFGSGKRPKVKVTINGYTYRSTIAPMGGCYLIPLAAEHREAAGVAAGQTIEIGLELDTDPREVDLPKDFASELDKSGLREVFDRLAFTHRKEHVRAIEEAKSSETRQRRIEKALAAVRAKA